MITAGFGGGQAGWMSASGMGPPLARVAGLRLIFPVGHPLWLPRVLRGPQGCARRAERSEPLWSSGVLGQPQRVPGREDEPPGVVVFIFEGGRGVRGRRPAVRRWLGAVMVAGWPGGWRVFAGAGRTRRR